MRLLSTVVVEVLALGYLAYRAARRWYLRVVVEPVWGRVVCG